MRVDSIKNMIEEGDDMPAVETKSYVEHPFQKFLDAAVDSLNGVSQTEGNTNMMIENYMAGKASLEDVMFAQNKASLEINLALTAINTAVSTFKEIQQMPV